MEDSCHNNKKLQINKSLTLLPPQNGEDCNVEEEQTINVYVIPTCVLMLLERWNVSWKQRKKST